MTINKNKTLDELTPEERMAELRFIDEVIANLIIELHSSSPSKSNQAGMRLPFWEDKRAALIRYNNQLKS